MKKNISLSVLFCIFMVKLFGQSITSKELISINKQADSVLSFYEKYATFTIDNEKISDSYLSGFRDLFSSGNVVILNDLNPATKSQEDIKPIKVDEYLKYVKEFYPTGLNSVEFKKVLKGTPEVIGNKINLEVKVQKEILGFYKDQLRFERTDTSKFLIIIDKTTRICKIDKIFPDKVVDDFCTINNNEALQPFMARQYGEARKIYYKTLTKCPDNEEAKFKIKICNSKLDSIANHKSIYILARINPAITNISVESSSNAYTATSSSDFTVGGGVGVEMDLYSKEKLKIGLGAGLSYLSIGTTINMEKYSDSVPQLTDIDGDNYTLLVSMKQIQEKLSISYLDIPIYAYMKYNLSKNFYVKAGIGVSMSIMIASKFESQSIGDYRGFYAQYYGIILYGNELSAYGFGNYHVNDSKSAGNSLKGTNFSAFGRFGIGYEFSRKVSAFIDAGYVYGLTNIFKDGGSDFHLSTGNSSMESLSGLLKGNTSQISMELGISYKIF